LVEAGFTEARRQSVPTFRDRLCAFVAIPKSNEYIEVSSLVSSSLNQLNVEEVRSPCDFTPSLLETCKKTDLLIADITKTNPSTYYVIGVSQALQKPVLLLSQTAAPPEISGFKVLKYRPGKVQKISDFLRIFLSEIVA
jgi:hypothetical protein